MSAIPPVPSVEHGEGGHRFDDDNHPRADATVVPPLDRHEPLISVNVDRALCLSDRCSWFDG